MNINQNSNIRIMRQLVNQFSHIEIERCIKQQINTGCNTCLQISDNEEMVNLLAKAGFMHSLISSGYKVNDALRELGKRMRVFNQG